ncbi:MAG: tRNA lysidine(34) synthetase TilS [Candidatus Omnitrophota bacterium]
MLTGKVRNTIKKYRLIDKKEKVIVAVSGGPDSVAMLYLLKGLEDELCIKLYIAHLDHMLRRNSHKDAEFVKALAIKLGIPAIIAKFDVKKTLKNVSLEEACRKARLEFLFEAAGKVKARKICLGHNLDDQAETVLMRLIRGSGLYGLSAILPKRKFSGFTLIRPLLEVKRKEIEAFLKKNKISFRIDETNKEDIYLRNRLRNRLLPLLEKEYNANIKEVLSSTALSAGYDYDYLFAAAQKALKRLGTKIRLPRFLKLHPAMQNLILRRSFSRVSGDTRRLTFKHTEEINDLILSRPDGSVVDLPKGVSAVKKKSCLIFYRR